MSDKTYEYLTRMHELLDECDSYSLYCSQLEEKLDAIFNLYQTGKINSMRYEALKAKLLGEKTRKELVGEYRNYINLILGKIHAMNAMLFEEVYSVDFRRVLESMPAMEEVKEEAVEEKKPKAAKKAKEAAKPGRELMSKAEEQKAEAEKLHELKKKVIRKKAAIEEMEVPKPVEKAAVLAEERKPVEKKEIPAPVTEAAVPVEVLEEKIPEVPEEVEEAEAVTEKVEEVKKGIERPVMEVAEKKSFVVVFVDRVRSFFSSIAAFLHMKKKPKAEILEKKEAEVKEAEIRVKAEEKAKEKPEKEVEKKTIMLVLKEFFSPGKKIAEEKVGKEKVEKKEVIVEIEKKPAEVEEMSGFKRLLLLLKSRLFGRKEETIVIPSELKAESERLRGVTGLEKVSIKTVLKNWIDKEFRKKEPYTGEGVEISPSLIRLADMSKKELDQIGLEKGVDPREMLREAQKIRKEMVKKKVGVVYKPLLIGSIANITVRPMTNYLINKFPDFFKDLYYRLRLANIQVLSSTYANIMVFSLVNIVSISFLFYTIISILKFQPLIIALLGGVAVSLVCGGITFAAFYMYPDTIISQRRKSIKTNLPFGLNHVAAIASSGIPPAKMFKLIADSMEYGEFCIELQKIVDYIELFGYDLTTAIKTVSQTTPEESLKEFFEGMVNTIESGGDLEKYVMAKSKEFMSTYQLERKKYAETVATYSDIYTGVLIAAPLFFVAALTLVSMLGGQLGGYNISTVIGFATYLLVPLLNVGFIVFLNISQPEI